MFSPEIRYARSDDVYIAYQVLGHGPLDMVFVPGFISHLEHYWEAPPIVRFAQRRGYGFTDAGPVVCLVVRGFVHNLAFQFAPGSLAELEAHFARSHTPLTWRSERLSPASDARCLWSVPPMQRSHDYPCSQATKRPLRRKNVPNTKQSATVITRLFLPIHACKDPSMVEARCGTAA